MARNRSIRFFFELIFFRLFSTTIAQLPRTLALSLGAWLGRCCHALFGKRRRMAEENMRHALSELSPTEVRSEVRKMFIHLGIVAMELLMLKRFHDEPDLSKYFDFEGLDNLREAHARGKGVLLLTGHLGFWEAGTFFLPKLGFPTAFIAKKMRNPRMDAFITRNRELSGGEVIDAKRGARRILKALGEGKVVCILPDQDNRDGEAVEFFGRPARTTTMVAQLALKTGAAVVPGFTLRTQDNRYLSIFEPPLDFPVTDGPDNQHENTLLVNQVLEKAIRREPSQWFWLHKRWRV